MKDWVKYLIRCFEWFIYNTKILSFPKYKEKRMRYELVKKSHSIEKGFCLRSVKEGFGTEKIKDILKDLDSYIEKEYNTSAAEFQICCGILKYYFEKQKILHNDVINSLNVKFEQILSENHISIVERYWGGIEKRKRDIDDIKNFDNLKTILENRDSVRNFAGGSVDIKKLEEAVRLAQTAPSACNRQPARVYILDHEKYYMIEKWVQGVGGFQEDVDKWLVITSDMAAFNKGELGQYIVSGSIFAGYLALILRTMGYATCMVQRNVLRIPKTVRKTLGISESEQAICVIAVGNMQEEYVVPKACRYSLDNIIKRV